MCIRDRAQADRAAKKEASRDMPKKMKGLKSRFVEFDGDLAQAWIDHDTKVREKLKSFNRNLTKSNVNDKADCMINESFMTTSQGITVDWNTAVIDGQHTLHAIVLYYETAVKPSPVRIYVTEGEDPGNFPFYDQGKNCLLYTSPSPRDATLSRMPSSA